MEFDGVELLCGKFLCIGDIHIINLEYLINVSKFDYVPERKGLTIVREGDAPPPRYQYCLLFVLKDNVTEVVSFETSPGRDLAFLKIKICMRGY